MVITMFTMFGRFMAGLILLTFLDIPVLSYIVFLIMGSVTFAFAMSRMPFG